MLSYTLTGNFILDADSYKVGHLRHLPKGTLRSHSNIVARKPFVDEEHGVEINEVVVLGPEVVAQVLKSIKITADPQQYLGSSTPDNSLTLHFPGFSGEAMAFLVHERKIRGVGIDTASIDPGQSKNFQAHQILGKANRYAIENVAYLDHVPARGATVYALPIKIKNGTGGPVRIIAVIP